MSENTSKEFSEVLKLAGLAILVSTIANVILYYIGGAVDAFGSDVINPGTDEELGVGDVITSNLAYLIIGTIGYFVIDRFTENTRSNFRNIAGLVLLVSFIFPFGIEDLSAVTYIFLSLMHIVSFVIFIYLLIYRE